MWWKVIILVFVVVLLAFFGRFSYSAVSAQNPEKFVIVKDGQPEAVIVVGKQAGEDEMFSAEELQSYIKKISGALIPIKKDDEEFPGNVIAVGRNKTNANANLAVDKLEREGFRIKTSGNVLSLAGKDDAGTQFAVYSFLEKYLGVRWLWPGDLGEVVPKMQTIEVGQINDTNQPDFKWRNRGPGGALWGATTGPTEMHARELLLGITREHQKEVELWEKRNKWGGMKIYGGHCLGEIFPPEKYGKTHPEYYALVNGKRDVPGADYDYKHEGQICTTNPEVVKVVVQWVRNFLDEHPDYDGVHITLNDGGGFCECEKCRALDVREVLEGEGIDAEETQARRARRTVITDRVYTYVNQVAEEVQKTHPGKYVVSMAYSRYITPPKRIKLHPFTVPQYCLWSCYRHANPEMKKEHEDIAAGWAKASEKTGIYEYFINGSWPGVHRLVTSHIADSIRYLYGQGIDLYQTQSGDEFGVNGINYYVAGKLLWDTSLDEQQILDDFYQKGFGKAAGPVKRFHKGLEQAWNEATKDGKDVSCNSVRDTRLLELFTPELLEQCRQDLAEAERVADDDLIRGRVEFYKKGFHYTELTVDAARATQKLAALDIDLYPSRSRTGGADPYPDEKVKQRIEQLDKQEIKKLVADALTAWEKRDGFVEELKNDYVLAYFWVRYNNLTRRFNPVENIRELSKFLGS
jgi:hypothetical protein